MQAVIRKDLKFSDSYRLGDFKVGQKIWLKQFGDLRYIYPGIIREINLVDGYIVVWKYALGLWVERWAYPKHLSPRTVNISADIFMQRLQTLNYENIE